MNIVCVRTSLRCADRRGPRSARGVCRSLSLASPRSDRKNQNPSRCRARGDTNTTTRSVRRRPVTSQGSPYPSLPSGITAKILLNFCAQLLGAASAGIQYNQSNSVDSRCPRFFSLRIGRKPCNNRLCEPHGPEAREMIFWERRRKVPYSSDGGAAPRPAARGTTPTQKRRPSAAQAPHQEQR